jgi:hypothetical protein
MDAAPDKGRIYVEVVPHPGTSGDLSPGDLVDKFSGRAAEVGSALATVASELRQTLESRLADRDEANWNLTEVSLQMSINLEAEAGVIISRTKAGAAFQAKLTWTRRADDVGRADDGGEATTD